MTSFSTFNYANKELVTFTYYCTSRAPDQGEELSESNVSLFSFCLTVLLLITILPLDSNSNGSDVRAKILSKVHQSSQVFLPIFLL